MLVRAPMVLPDDTHAADRRRVIAGDASTQQHLLRRYRRNSNIVGNETCDVNGA